MVNRRADTLTGFAHRQLEDPNAFIANRNPFGDLAGHERLRTAYRSALASLHQHGGRATLEPLA